MKAEELYKGIIEIDDRYIEESRETKLNAKHITWKRYTAVAACLCLIALSAVVAFHGKERPAEVYHLSLVQDSAQGQDTAEICTLSFTDQSTDIKHFVTLEDGTMIPAVFVPATFHDSNSNDVDMTLEEAQSFAYMDLDTAPAELRETILKAREVIIYSQSWVADGLEAYITSPDGTKRSVPAFSELFPGWELPTIDPSLSTMTPDGLGRDAKYGVFVEIAEIMNDYIMGRVTSASTPFQTGQRIQVYFPEDFDVSQLRKGTVQFVSYYGKDCDGANGTVRADEISAYYGD